MSFILNICDRIYRETQFSGRRKWNGNVKDIFKTCYTCDDRDKA